MRSDVPTNVIARLVAILKSNPTGRTGEMTVPLSWTQSRTNASARAPEPSPATNANRELTFEDLPSPLQEILAVQLRDPGDVSAMIETPGRYMLCVATQVRGNHLHVATLAIPKRTYEEWLGAQAETKP